MLLMDRYETRFGIYNHDVGDPKRVLALVAHHWEEDITVGCSLKERAKQFMLRKMSEKLGISWLEFLELPRDHCLMLLELAAEDQKAEGAIVDQASHYLDSIVKQRKD